MATAASLARGLDGQRQGHNWRCVCPLGCGYALSLRDGEDGRLLAYCFGGCNHAEVMLALVEYGLFDDDDLHVDHDHVDRRRDDAERIALARRIYDSGAWDERISVYLRSRSIHLISPVLRFREAAPHRLGARLPAMLAPVVDVNGDQTGVHMTFLKKDGGGKIDFPKEYQRECRGRIRGGAIRLTPHDPDQELIVGEGIESTFSAMQLFTLPGWSAVYAGGLKTLELPPSIHRIVIAADNDTSGTGQRNALMALVRWESEGRQVRIVMPRTAGDFNDVLMGRGR